ncbi:Dal2 protein [Candida orthopsilosis Co 90-125]|uniref:allantoicase n=1 Tax=Candida orthopsilosis (strain 90-125) TaxID=1136231 RepID=H8WYZ9_CANO9|nr:Dal2 protein [Candida orthopsilosis Co 90-125]CCG21631.1 Dal2 protein [Candida orthopsilosis Co 90-125]
MAKVLTESQFQSQIVSKYVDVIGEKLDGKIHSFSDEWFAQAENLIKPKAPIRDATKFTYAGAWYDGWETRRHNEQEADWVIFKFGVSSANLIGCEVDTAFFNGNHAPAISVEAVQVYNDSELEKLGEKDWETVIPKTECGPSQKHFFARDKLTEKNYTHARLRMYPDGGIARFRLYGHVVPITKDTSEVVDFASVKNGGVAIKVSDQHFGTADNLLLPGRGHDMSDGWETKRSREPGHTDWVVIRLGAPAHLQKIVIDTAHFRGNFPQKVNVKGTSVKNENDIDSAEWVTIIPDSKTSADKEHEFSVKDTKAFSHIKVTIIPDGGVKRIRAFGVKA